MNDIKSELQKMQDRYGKLLFAYSTLNPEDKIFDIFKDAGRLLEIIEELEKKSAT